MVIIFSPNKKDSAIATTTWRAQRAVSFFGEKPKSAVKNAFTVLSGGGLGENPPNKRFFLK
ncbi:MAG: hypothetical protein AAF378_22420 [Cyanobacteria bacterium P01_A01_bin.84]